MHELIQYKNPNLYKSRHFGRGVCLVKKVRPLKIFLNIILARTNNANEFRNIPERLLISDSTMLTTWYSSFILKRCDRVSVRRVISHWCF